MVYESADMKSGDGMSTVRSRFVDYLVSPPPVLPHMSWQSDERCWHGMSPEGDV